MRFTAYGFCPVVAVVMLESRVARCLHCAEGVAWQACFGRLYAHHHQATPSAQRTHLATRLSSITTATTGQKP